MAPRCELTKQPDESDNAAYVDGCPCAVQVLRWGDSHTVLLENRMDSTTKLAAKLKLSERELLIEIGRNVGLYESVPPDEVAEEEGRRWFRDRYERLRTSVCVPAVRDALDGTMGALGLAVLNRLGAIIGADGVETVAALLIKHGLDRMCGWE